MYLKDIREWLKPQMKEATFYIGKIDNSKEKVIGLYNRASSNNKIAVGGLKNTSAANKRICNHKSYSLPELLPDLERSLRKCYQNKVISFTVRAGNLQRI